MPLSRENEQAACLDAVVWVSGMGVRCVQRREPWL
jgi:hypothetical protein